MPSLNPASVEGRDKQGGRVKSMAPGTRGWDCGCVRAAARLAGALVTRPLGCGDTCGVWRPIVIGRTARSDPGSGGSDYSLDDAGANGCWRAPCGGGRARVLTGCRGTTVCMIWSAKSSGGADKGRGGRWRRARSYRAGVGAE